MIQFLYSILLGLTKIIHSQIKNTLRQRKENKNDQKEEGVKNNQSSFSNLIMILIS